MEKKKKYSKKLHIIMIILLVSIIICAIVLGLCIFSDELLAFTKGDSPSLGTNSIYTDDFQFETDSQVSIRDTYTLEVAPYPSYLELCEKDYVEPPSKRTREQALKKIEELAPYYPAMWIILENQDKYSSGLILSVAANPEMTDFAYHYLTSDGSVTGGIKEEECPEDYPLFLQWDKRWGYFSYGDSIMATAGCGPSCLSMAIYYLTGDKSVTPDCVATYSIANNHYVPNVGTAWTLLDTYPKTFGLTVNHPSLNEENLKSHLDQGRILICSVRPGNFTYSGHFIVIYGYDENGFKINDPKCIYRSRQSWTFEQIKNDIKRTWSIGH